MFASDTVGSGTEAKVCQQQGDSVLHISGMYTNMHTNMFSCAIVLVGNAGGWEYELTDVKAYQDISGDVRGYHGHHGTSRDVMEHQDIKEYREA